MMSMAYRVFTAWAALVAVLLGALAPAISQAAASPAGLPPGFAEICSAVANPILPPLQDQAPAGGHEQAGAGHCPFCLPHSGTDGALLSAALPFAIDACIHPRLIAHRAACASTGKLAAALARAPPA